ncbi:hypothetical protein [Chryseobacterium taiwanense]|uniref:DUF3828 domain-containing protein n=1 Tax=Chryseobacterium taiwanense TaxID=363331 RepID=A0A0B4CSS8_9FLAO|nr:hypothetical protein [Chryseobacterium taiwanense]KIC64254.1 hypothetical protein RM51_05960 [Chryseobacterium taiwanense]
MEKIIIASLFLMISCKDKTEAKKNLPCNGVYIHHSKESNEAEKWLKNSIESYFKTDLGNLDDAMRRITTKDYYQYKTDAMNVDLGVDGSLTEKQFQEKWKGKFDSENAGIGVGFLITGQDWGDIKVSMCELTFQNGREFMFNVILKDEELKEHYAIRVKVIKEKENYFIADVIQEIPKN